MDNQYKEVELFDGKNLSDVFKDIYDNHSSKKQQLKDLIASLTPLIEGIGDATLLVPLIKEYLEISVKNDEQLVKLAQIVQRIESGKKQSSSDTDFMFADLQNLLEEDKNIGNAVEEIKEQSPVKQ